ARRAVAALAGSRQLRFAQAEPDELARYGIGSAGAVFSCAFGRGDVFLAAREGHHRSVAKAISWRLTGSIDTLLLSYLVTKNLVFASSIASAETITKVVLYYAHERAWTAIPWGRRSRMHLGRLGRRGWAAA